MDNLLMCREVRQKLMAANSFSTSHNKPDQQQEKQQQQSNNSNNSFQQLQHSWMLKKSVKGKFKKKSMDGKAPLEIIIILLLCYKIYVMIFFNLWRQGWND